MELDKQDSQQRLENTDTAENTGTSSCLIYSVTGTCSRDLQRSLQ